MRWKTTAMALVLWGLFLTCAPNAPAQHALAQQRFVVIAPVPVGPIVYPYPYFGYPGYYYYPNVGYVKLDTHRKDATVYIDGGYAAKVKDTKRFVLRPGNHEIELRDSDGSTFYQEEVAVTVGHTTKLHMS